MGDGYRSLREEEAAAADLVPPMTRISTGLETLVRWLKAGVVLLALIALLLVLRVLGVGA